MYIYFSPLWISSIWWSLPALFILIWWIFRNEWETAPCLAHYCSNKKNYDIGCCEPDVRADKWRMWKSRQFVKMSKWNNWLTKRRCGNGVFEGYKWRSRSLWAKLIDTEKCKKGLRNRLKLGLSERYHEPIWNPDIYQSRPKLTWQIWGFLLDDLIKWCGSLSFQVIFLLV